MECIFRQHFQTNFLHCPSQLECALLFQIRMILTSVFFVTAMMCSCCGDTFALFTLTGGKKLNMFVLRTIWAGPVKRTPCSWHEGMGLRGPRPLCARKIPWNPVNFPEDDALPLCFVVVVTLIMINTDLVGFIALLWMILLCSLTPNEWILFIEPVAFCSDMSLNDKWLQMSHWSGNCSILQFVQQSEAGQAMGSLVNRQIFPPGADESHWTSGIPLMRLIPLCWSLVRSLFVESLWFMTELLPPLWWCSCHWRYYHGGGCVTGNTGLNIELKSPWWMRGDTTLVVVQVSLAILLVQLSRSGLPCLQTLPGRSAAYCVAVASLSLWRHTRCQHPGPPPLLPGVTLHQGTAWWFRYIRCTLHTVWQWELLD